MEEGDTPWPSLRMGSCSLGEMESMDNWVMETTGEWISGGGQLLVHQNYIKMEHEVLNALYCVLDREYILVRRMQSCARNANSLVHIDLHVCMHTVHNQCDGNIVVSVGAMTILRWWRVFKASMSGR